jgi:hypothetical protein
VADLKISQLTELTTAANDDKIPIVDTSETETKYIQKSNLAPERYQMILTHLAVTPADSTSYYFGGLYGAVPTAAGVAYYRTLVPKAGTITDIYVSIGLGGANGTAEDSTLTLLKTGSAFQEISAAAKYNAQYGSITLTGLSLAVAQGDQLSIKWDTPAWVTNPNSVYHNVTLFITV